jgi:hypothetical protein
MENEKTNDVQFTAAKVVSWIFHPLLIPLYGLLIIFAAPTLFCYLPFKVKKILFLVLITNNVLIPLSLIPFLRYRKLIGSWSIEKRKERIIPLIAVLILYSITTFIMVGLPIPVFVKGFFISTAFLILIVLVINFWWKISLHSAGAGALLGIVVTLSLRMSVSLTWFLILSVMISGLVLTSRLKLSMTSPAQVYIGFLTGLAEMTLFLILFQ